ncbi:hypothetical protein HDU96_009705 [Phlyctochytrium bullatum]|nr:hypothetical protein HDU96_009705 [Phlyctochytrium bullatum]
MLRRVVAGNIACRSAAVAAIPRAGLPLQKLQHPSQPLQVRTVLRKTGFPPQVWTKNSIEMQIIDMLYDYANVPPEKISLEANLETSLLLDRIDRYGFQWDLLDV